MGKKNREREREKNSSIIMMITIEFPGVIEFLDLNPPRWKGILFLYRLYLFSKGCRVQLYLNT